MIASADVDGSASAALGSFVFFRDERFFFGSFSVSFIDRGFLSCGTV